MVRVSNRTYVVSFVRRTAIINMDDALLEKAIKGAEQAQLTIILAFKKANDVPFWIDFDNLVFKEVPTG